MKNEDMKMLSRVASLLSDFNSSFIELAELLNEAQQTNPKLFQSLHKLPGLKRRRAYYLAEIGRVFGPMAIEKSTLIDIGPTKLARIAPHITPHNVEWILNFATNHTDKQLKDYFSGERLKKSTRVVVLYLAPKDHATFADTLVKYGACKKGKGLTGREDALMKIIKAVSKKQGG